MRALGSIVMALMTTRMMVRNGAECLGRSGQSLRSVLRCAGSSRTSLASPGASTRSVRLGQSASVGRSLVSIRASSVTTTADAAAATSAAAPFKRHERIAAIKVRAPVRASCPIHTNSAFSARPPPNTRYLT